MDYENDSACVYYAVLFHQFDLRLTLTEHVRCLSDFHQVIALKLVTNLGLPRRLYLGDEIHC